MARNHIDVAAVSGAVWEVLADASAPQPGAELEYELGRGRLAVARVRDGGLQFRTDVALGPLRVLAETHR